MATRTVTGTIKHLDDTAWANGIVRFKLLEPFSTATQVLPKDDMEEVLDVNGYFIITLVVPDTGTAHYTVELPDESLYEFYIAAGAATDLMTILTISGSAVAQSDLQTLLDTYTTISISDFSASDIAYDPIEYLRCTGDITITLPLASGTHHYHVIKNIGTGTVTVVPTGGDLIDGVTSVLIGPKMFARFIDVQGQTWNIM